MSGSLDYFIGYHGTSERLVGRIVNNYTESDNLRAGSRPDGGYWLGRGVYFYQNDPFKALQWARNNSQISDPAVVGALIAKNDCLDLTLPEFYEPVRDVYKILRDEYHSLDKPLPINDEKTGIHALDDQVFTRFEKILQKALPQKDDKPLAFKTVRAIFHSMPLFTGSCIYDHDVIISVRDPKAIVGCFRYPRKIMSIQEFYPD